MTKDRKGARRPGRVTPEQLLEDVRAEDLARRLAEEARKTERIEIRVSPSEKELIQTVASECGVSVAAFVTTAVKIAAEKMVERREAKVAARRAATKKAKDAFTGRKGGRGSRTGSERRGKAICVTPKGKGGRGS